MTHRDAIIDGYSVEFLCNAASPFDFSGDELTEIL
jgi:hypothetical protein